MKLPNFLKWKYSAVIIVVTGLTLCYISYRLGLIKEGTLNSREEQLYALILTVAVPTGLTFSSAVVNREIKELSGKEIEAAHQERDKAINRCKAEIGRFQNLYVQKLDIIKDELEPLKESKDVYSQLCHEIENCQAIFEEFKTRSRSAEDIAHWLSSKANRIQIRNWAIAEAKKQYSIPAYKMTVFRNDIGRSINWLRDSIFALQVYEVRKEELVRASQDIPGGIKAYLAAFEAIKSHPDLTRLSSSTNVLQYFIEQLSEKLQKQSA